MNKIKIKKVPKNLKVLIGILEFISFPTDVVACKTNEWNSKKGHCGSSNTYVQTAGTWEKAQMSYIGGGAPPLLLEPRAGRLDRGLAGFLGGLPWVLEHLIQHFHRADWVVFKVPWANTRIKLSPPPQTNRQSPEHTEILACPGAG